MYELVFFNLHYGLMPLFIFSTVTLIILSLFRVYLILWKHHRIPTGKIPYLLLQGIRIDLATICALYSPCFITLCVLSLIGTANWILIEFLNIYLSVSLCFLILNEVATYGFIEEYGVRPNHIYIQYLCYPKEVLKTLLFGHKISVLISVILLPATALGTYRFSAFLLDDFIPLAFPFDVVSTFLCMILLPLGVRSTLGHRPINPSMLSFCNDPLVNSLLLNSTYSAAYAFTHFNLNKLTSKQIYAFDSAEHVINEGCNLSERNLPCENFLNPFVQHINSVSANRKNVVIILMESLGAEFVQSLGGVAVTPNLEQLKNKGWWFANMYAAGHRSVRGIEAVTAGFPPSPLRSIVKMPQPRSSYASLSRIYKLAGYHTMFVYGGESHFDNMRSYFLENGTNEVIDERDYKDPHFVGSWGVSDEDLFDRAHSRFLALSKDQKNFFSVIFTSSFHDPFEIPKEKVTLGEIKTKEPKRLLAAKYSDFALGEFFRKAQASAYYKNTVFLIIADHESRVRGEGGFPFSQFSIPALILGSDIKAREDNRIVSQIDMPPTLLALSGICGDFPCVGQNLTLQKIKERALMQFNEIFAYLENDILVTLAPEKRHAFFKIDNNKKLVPISDDLVLLKKAIALSNLGPYLYKNELITDKYIKIL